MIFDVLKTLSLSPTSLHSEVILSINDYYLKDITTKLTCERRSGSDVESQVERQVRRVVPTRSG
jgi:hypothetical protein